MKTPIRLPLVASVIVAVAVTAIAPAQPPPRNPSDAGAGAGPIPSPGRPGSGYPAPLGRVAIPPPDAPPPRHRRPPPPPSTGGTVVEIQRALKARGYYRGPIDGDAGPGTRGAIRSFRMDHGLGSSTRIDSGLLRALRL